MLTQISIFTENRKGAMKQLLSVLAKEQINLLALVTNDSAEYGIVRMVVSEPEKAYELLKNAGYLCKTTTVLGVELADKPGALASMMEVLDRMNINVDYIYLSYRRATGYPLLILHTESMQEVEDSLLSQGFRMITGIID